LDFCFDILEKTKDYAIAAKPNQQYVIGFTKNQHQKLTRMIRKSGLLSILDYKLNDINETAESGIFHLVECGYDAITFNPLPGNLEEATKCAHDFGLRSRGHELGLIVLTLMSNPGAVRYMKKARLSGKPLYVAIAEDVREYNADGCVVGATGHVTEEDVGRIRQIVGEEKIFLVPGVGFQRGGPEKAIKFGGRNILINIGRSIIYSANPSEEARKYSMMLNKIRVAATTAH